jgi:hypothetical protein
VATNLTESLVKVKYIPEISGLICDGLAISTTVDNPSFNFFPSISIYISFKKEGIIGKSSAENPLI